MDIIDYISKSDFKRVVLDIGTGDGRYIYKNALNNPNDLFIGIDPAQNLKEFQREINRKRLKNAILINSSIENFKLERAELFDEIQIILPWGNLLKYCVSVDKEFFIKISKWLKKEGLINIIFGFNEEYEEKITKRLNLKDLNDNEVSFLKSNLESLEGLRLLNFQTLTPKNLKNFETTWSKKLNFGANRTYFYITLQKI